MAEYGLGNFIYEITFDGKAANFAFRDPEDVTNVAEASVSRDEFPEGINQPDSRQVADIAYTLVSKELNDKRDERLKQEAIDATETQLDKEAHEREVANDFHDKSEELGNHEPTGTVPDPVEDKAAPAHTPTDRQNDEQKDSGKSDDGDKADKNDKKK